MNSIDSKSHSCKNVIESPIHQPLQIRTNKHRCFVFCLGHTSLTCVPGIGKKNKHLLNRSGINDLSTLYRKYRSINNMQRFKQWLENEIGFTSYQAKMTACGIASKLGEIVEINTGLSPICCPGKERRETRNINKRHRNVPSKKNGDRKEEIKLDKLSPNSNVDRSEVKEKSLFSKESSDNDPIRSSSKEKLDYLTGIKSPDDPIFATRPPSTKKKDQFDSTSSSTIDETTNDNNEKSEIPYRKGSTINPSNISPQINSDQPKKDRILPKQNRRVNVSAFSEQDTSFEEKKSVSHSNPDSKSSISPSNNKATDVNSSKTGKLNQIFSLTKQKLQPTLDALQDRKDELLSASKHSSDSSITNEHPRKSTAININIPLAGNEQKQQQQEIRDEPLKTTLSLDNKREKTTTSRNDDSDEDEKKSTATIKRPRVSSLLSAATVFPNESDVLNSTKFTPENNLIQQGNSAVSRAATSTILNPPSLNLEDALQESTSNQVDPSLRKSQEEKLQEEISKTVSQIMKQAAYIVHNNIQSTPNDSMLTTRVKSREAPPIRNLLDKTKTKPDTMPSVTLPSNETNKNDVEALQSLEKESSASDKFLPSTSDQLKQASTGPFLTDKSSIKPNLNENLTHPSNTMVNNPKLSSNRSNELSKGQDPNTDNKPAAATQIHDDRLQHQQSSLTVKVPAPTEMSPTMQTTSEILKIKPSTGKNSLSTLSSLSDSNQSLVRIPSSNDKIQSKLNSKTPFEQIPRSLAISSPNITLFPTEDGKQLAFTSTPEYNHSERDKPEVPIIPANRTNQSPNLKENQLLDNNLSEIANSEYQSVLIPSFPTACHALWDNISNEQILSQRKNYRRTLLKKNRSAQKIKQHDRNQNHHSSTTSFTYFTHQQRLKEDKVSDENIPPIKRIKTVLN